MFGNDTRKKEKAKKVVKYLTDYRSNKSHDRHIHAEECEKIGLVIERIENDQTFQDLLLTVHHCFMHSLMNTPSYKIIENHLGAALVKQKGVYRAVPEKSVHKKDVFLIVCPGRVDKKDMVTKFALELKDSKLQENELMSALPAGGVRIC